MVKETGNRKREERKRPFELPGTTDALTTEFDQLTQRAALQAREIDHELLPTLPVLLEFIIHTQNTFLVITVPESVSLPEKVLQLLRSSEAMARNPAIHYSVSLFSSTLLIPVDTYQILDQSVRADEKIHLPRIRVPVDVIPEYADVNVHLLEVALRINSYTLRKKTVRIVRE
jgi:hypothetical protein